MTHREKTVKLCKDLIQATEALMKHLLIGVDIEEKEKRNSQSGLSKANITYDKLQNTVYIDAPESDFVPEYLKYVLQHLGIPDDVKIIFKK